MIGIESGDDRVVGTLLVVHFHCNNPICDTVESSLPLMVRRGQPGCHGASATMTG